jgi:glyoxylase-like metal-dependent hydrolase (beta-lactamase superfamily II)
MKILPLSEGAFTIDTTKQFIPFNVAADDLQKRTTGSLLVEIQPFCIVTEKDILLIDTGLGFSNKKGSLQIHQNLLDSGINPMDVTKVLLSHLHVNREEFDFAMKKGKPSYSPDEFELLGNTDRVVFTEGNGTIDGYITYEVTGAHSPYHQVFWIEDGGEKIFFGGDVAPQLQQMKSRFIAKYDYDGKKCMELRGQWWQQGQEENWIFLFYHDIKTPVFRF